MSRPRVLIVDDDEHICFVAARALEKIAVCDAAHDVGQATRALQRQAYDVVLVDVGLPGPSGMTLLEDLRRNWPQTGAVMLSGFTDLTVATEALELGALGYVVKPFRVRDLRIQVTAALARVHRTAHTGLASVRARIVTDLDAFRSDHDDRVACVVVDLECVPLLNASYGVEAIERLCECVEQRLREFGGGVEVLGRLGPATFAASFRLQREAAVAETARALYRAVGAPAFIDGQRIPISARLGVAVESIGEGADSILNLAEGAASTARECGQPFVVYDGDLRDTARFQQKLLADVATAIHRSQLHVAYQAQHDLQTGACVGIEALVRWRHPTEGDVPPSVFVPLAERVDLIGELGMQVLRTACRDLARLRRNPNLSTLRVSVNASAAELRDPDYPGRVASALEDAALPASALRLEITESLALDDSDDVDAVLGAIGDLGVQLSVDDFGTGYSSFSALTRIPWAELKLDRSLTVQCEDPKGRAMLRAVVAFGTALDLDVMAEGIETSEQLEALRAIGCRYGQGFLLGHPQPIAGITLHFVASRGERARSSRRQRVRDLGERHCALTGPAPGERRFRRSNLPPPSLLGSGTPRDGSGQGAHMNARATTSPVRHADRFFIGGEWVAPTTDAGFDVIDSGTEDVYYTVAAAAADDMTRAVASARTAFDDGPWTGLSHKERAEYLLALGDAVAERGDALSQLWPRESGVLFSTSQYAGHIGKGALGGYAALADTFPFEEECAPSIGGKFGLLVREPVGVVGAIIPWNAPVALICHKIGPALLAGCTVVLKSSPEAPGEGLIFAEAAEQIGLPPGVLNVVTADREVSELLVTNPGVDKITFTGSTAAGRRIASLCGERIARCTLELGGKSAAVILDDMDLGTAAKTLAKAECGLNGQVCSSLTRVIVTKDRHDELVEALAASFGRTRVGDPFDETSQLGPLVSDRQRDRVLGLIQKGIDEGATLATGGGRPADLDRGYFVEPTVFGNVSNDSTIGREEIFGPVLSVIKADDEKDAVRLANDTIYGLNASVFTNDADRARAVAGQLRSGTVGHNAFRTDFAMAFGGFKQSGIGREGGKEGLLPFLETKSVILEARPAAYGSDD